MIICQVFNKKFSANFEKINIIIFMNIYAILSKYISKYAPSRKKISDYIAKKWNFDANKILSEIGYDENLMMDMWIRTFIATGKSELEIKQKLLLKWFEKEKILQKIQKFSDEIYDFANFENSIKIFINSKLAKWKSINFIKWELFKKFSYFKDEITEILAEYNDNSSLQKEIEKYSQKYNLEDKKDLQKFYSALLRKWFAYGEIKNFLKNNY